MLVENIRKLQDNTATLYTERKTLRVSAIRRSGYVYPENLKRLPLPSGCEIFRCKMSMHGSHPNVKCRRTERPPFPSGCEISGWGGMPTGYNSSPCARCRDSSPGGLGACKDIQINSIRIPQTERRRNAIRRSSIRTIAYTIRICCLDRKHWLKWVSEPCYNPRSAALR